VSNNSLKLSVIVPFYNESESIRGMHRAIVDALEPLRVDFEMLFVDDGSKDDTALIATEIARRDARVTVLIFRRNSGQTAAMAAGIEHACGEVLITMDGDLQNDPRDIPLFLTKIHEGFDLVVGWRANRQDKLVSRKIPSRIANWLIAKTTGVAIRDNGCSLKAYKAAMIKSIPLYSEMHRFIPAMASIAGPRIAEIMVRHHARQFGQSKYGLSRIYKVLLDILVIKTVATFATRPLQWFGLLSVPLWLAALAILTYSAVVAIQSNTLPPLPLIGSGLVLFSAAALLLGGGALAEQVCRLGEVREVEFSRLTQAVNRHPHVP
jgi:glycosyltransferase involved in cell wall biosynthesis